MIFPHRDRDAQLQVAISGLHGFLQVCPDSSVHQQSAC